MTFKEMILNETEITPNAIEYIKRDLFKKKKLSTACTAFVKKFKGETALLGNVNYTAKELEDDVMLDIAKVTIDLAKTYNEGTGYIALLGSAHKYNVDLYKLKDEIIKITKGENINGILS